MKKIVTTVTHLVTLALASHFIIHIESYVVEAVQEGTSEMAIQHVLHFVSLEK
jgi:uncharacterized protein YxeA